MTLAKQMEKMALKYAKNNAITMPGDIVETVWGNWKKPHRVMVYCVGARLVTRYRDKCHYWDGKGWVAEFDMKYSALRLYKAEKYKIPVFVKPELYRLYPDLPPRQEVPYLQDWKGRQ